MKERFKEKKQKSTERNTGKKSEIVFQYIYFELKKK